MAQLSINRDDLARYVSAIFRYADEGTWVSLRVFDEHRKDVAPVIDAVQIGDDLTPVIDKACQMAELAARRPRPSVFAPPAATFASAERAREQDLACALALCAEMDHDAQAGVDRLRQILGPPTLVAASGGRWRNGTDEDHDKLHAYWRYSEAACGNDIALSKRARVAAAALIGGDPTNGPDSHPIRWPGSWHRKTNPRLSRIVELNEDAEVELRDAVERLEEACRSLGKRPMARPSIVDQTIMPGHVDPDKLMLLREVSREFKKAWSEGYKNAAGVPDHSQCDWWLALEAARAGWPDDEIAALISAFRNKVGEGDKATPGYLGHTIGKVRTAINSGRTVFDDGLLSVEAALESNDRAKAIEALGKRLGLAIRNVIITGTEDALAYWLEVDGRESRILLGTAGQLLMQGHVQTKLLQSSSIIIPTCKPAVWHGIVLAIVSVADREDAADSLPIAQLNEVIERYLREASHLSWEHHAYEAVFNRLPVERGGKAWAHIDSLVSWWAINSPKASRSGDDVRILLRASGRISEKLSARSGDRVCNRSYWEVGAWPG